MAIVGTNTALNQYVPTFFIKNLKDGQSLVYDAVRKAYINSDTNGNSGATRLGELLDVSPLVDNPLSLKAGQALVYNVSTSLWENAYLDYNTLLNKPTSSNFSFAGLSDTTKPPLADGYVKWNSTGTTLVYSTTIPSSSITGLSVVATTGNYNDLLNKPPFVDITPLQQEINNIEASLGSIVNPDGTWNNTALTNTNVWPVQPVNLTAALNTLANYTPAVGPVGPKGDIGLQGPIGPQGLPGTNGAAGAQGIQGLKGDTGLQGPAGIQGIQGLKGDTGLQGPAGANGVDGAQGLQGLPGTNGAAGAQGIQGPIGLTGPQGLKGDTGLQGVKGDTGAIGPMGPAGSAADLAPLQQEIDNIEASLGSIVSTNGVWDGAALTNTTIWPTAPVDLTSALNTLASATGTGIVTLTGDVTGSGTGTITTALANVGTAGVYGTDHYIPIITVNNKGLVTAVTTQHVDNSIRDLVIATDTIVIEARHQYIVTSTLEVDGRIENNGRIAIL